MPSDTITAVEIEANGCRFRIELNGDDLRLLSWLDDAWSEVERAKAVEAVLVKRDAVPEVVERWALRMAAIDGMSRQQDVQRIERALRAVLGSGIATE